MTTLDHTAFATTSVRPTSITERAVNLVSTLFRFWKNRQALHALGALSDAELADIGLRRVDLFAASASSFFRDPTEQLSAVAKARVLEGEQAARQVC